MNLLIWCWDFFVLVHLQNKLCLENEKFSFAFALIYHDSLLTKINWDYDWIFFCFNNLVLLLIVHSHFEKVEREKKEKRERKMYIEKKEYFNYEVAQKDCFNVTWIHYPLLPHTIRSYCSTKYEYNMTRNDQTQRENRENNKHICDAGITW